MSEYITPTPPLTVEQVLVVPQEEVARNFPSAGAAVALSDEIVAMSTEERLKISFQSGESEPVADEGGIGPRARQDRRSVKGSYANTLREATFAGTHYVATLEPGAAEEALDGIFAERFGVLLNADRGFFIKMIRASAPYVQSVHEFSKAATAEINAVTARGAAAGYWLAKILATNVGADAIAVDLMRAANTEHPVSPEMARVRWFNDFTAEVAQTDASDPQLHRRTASLVAHWPTEARSVVVSAQEVLLGGLSANLALARQWLERERFLRSDPRQDFEQLLDRYVAEYVNRVQLNALPLPERQAVLHAKAAVKRRHRAVPGTTPRRERRGQGEPAEPITAGEAVPAEPLKVVTCSLTNGTAVEGVEALVADFLARASQGQGAKEDLDRVLDHMTRVDLPDSHRRGVKSLRRSVRFAGERYKLWEMKPPDAGLSLRAEAVKTSRVYFIRLPGATLGILGIEPRAEQAKFLRNLMAPGGRR